MTTAETALFRWILGVAARVVAVIIITAAAIGLIA